MYIFVYIYFDLNRGWAPYYRRGGAHLDYLICQHNILYNYINYIISKFTYSPKWYSALTCKIAYPNVSLKIGEKNKISWKSQNWTKKRHSLTTLPTSNQNFLGYKWNDFLRRCFLFWCIPISWLSDEIWSLLYIGCVFRKNQNKKNRFICSHETFDSTSVYNLFLCCEDWLFKGTESGKKTILGVS